MKRKNIGMRTYLWRYFCTFAVAIMILLLVLQIFFFNAFSKSFKLKELEKTGNKILSEYDFDKKGLKSFWDDRSFTPGAFVSIISENGEFMGDFSYRHFGRPLNDDITDDEKMPPRENSPYNTKVFEQFISTVNSSESGKVSYIDTNKLNNAQFAVYGAYIGKFDGKKMYLYLSSPLERTDITRRVLQTQLIIVAFISIILSLILAYFIAKRLSKPIEKITEGAHNLAKGDYGSGFENGSYHEINELADALNHAADELSKTEELRKDLISNISHDLRTPLTIIKSYAEMIRDISGNNEEKRNKHTGVIIDETNRLSLLVNDLLDLSKIQSGTVSMDIKPFDINKNVRSMLSVLDFYREREGYEFSADLLSAKEVLGDERRIEQVIYNLIGNAINYTGEDKKIFITTSDTKNGVIFSVRDTGKGIPENELDYVWDKYYKSANTHTRQAVGTGIGLSIVKNILNAHNAEFGVDTKEGEGSTFWFELPSK